jgi:hypothetical protein
VVGPARAGDYAAPQDRSFDRAQVEALAAEREARQLEAERRRVQQWEAPRLVLPPDQEATFEELMAAAEWTQAAPGPFVDTEGAAHILGVTQQYVARLAAQGRLPWLPTGRLGGGPTRVYRRAQIEVIARARSAQSGLSVVSSRSGA